MLLARIAQPSRDNPMPSLYAVDPRTWKGPGHPAAAYIYSQNRNGEHPAGHLAGFHGKLQVDGYTGFSALVKRGDGTIELVFCWAHCRRRFYEFHAATKSPLAAEALAQIARLYAIEAEIRGQPPEHRRAIRQQRSRPIVEAMQTWLKATQARVSSASPLADAISYMLRHWSGLVLFLDDGRLEIDSNVVERGMKGVLVLPRPGSSTGKVVSSANSTGADSTVETIRS
jgi:transposase